jgi:hypothetical protein
MPHQRRLDLVFAGREVNEGREGVLHGVRVAAADRLAD